MARAMLRQTRWTILLSINAAAILIAGILIASAIWGNGGLEFRVVGERSDVVDGGEELANGAMVDEEVTEAMQVAYAEGLLATTTSYEFDSSPVPSGELWNESAVTIYATPDIDICVGGSLSNLGDMYWQTSDPSVIAGFYNASRSWLGYSSDTCRYPVIAGTGTVTITAGTYDGKRKDSIIINVVEPSAEQWEYEVLGLVNKLRVKNGLSQLSWGSTCANAALTRAGETIELYSHTRPDGSSWSTACPVPSSGGTSGENLAIGNAAVSPATVVALWMASDAHRENILNPTYTKLAVGFVFNLDTQYKTYWSQYFSTY